MSATPPPADLRARVLAAANAEPASPRAAGARRRAMALVAGFAAPLAISLYLGWPRSGGRPFAYVASLSIAWLAVGLLATWGGVSRGPSMLGRPASLRLVVAALTPVALLVTALVAALAWPQTLADDATVVTHLICVGFALLCALGPLVAFAVVRRGSDPVAPRLTGAAIGAASGAWGALAIELHCGHASPAHIVLGHLLPVVALTLVGILVGDGVVAVPVPPLRADAAMHDVIIVGGGPAGSTTALALAAAAPWLAPRVVVLEKARYPREKPCAGALGARGDALLRELGVDVDVPSAAIDGMSFRGTGIEVTASPGRIGRVVRRLEFDAALARAVRSRGIEVREGVRVDRVTDDGLGAVLETTAGTVRARVVAGCDGVGSVVRKALGHGAGKLRAQVVEVDTEAARGDPNRSLLHFDASDRSLPGYAWDFPTVVDGRPLVCRGVYRLKVDGGPGDEGHDVSAVLAARLRAQGIDPARCKNKRYAERGFEPATYLARGALMLVGEAAGIDPVTGEGIAQAIEYGVLAGRFLARRFTSEERLPAVDEWHDEVGASRLARDLRIRTRFVRLFYGPARPEVERFLAETPDALYVGCQHFAAQPYDWVKLADVLARGAAGLLGVRIGEALRR